MRTEIGSEFWEVPTGKENGLFPLDTGWFQSGRSALHAIISPSGIHSVALPSWCCDSMIKPFLDAGVKVGFYPVYMDGGLVQDISGVVADGILVMDYFGYTEQIDVAGFPGVVIRDVTHSLFSKTYQDADYSFGSLRKWAGFWTGGFGWGLADSNLPEDEVYAALRKTAMEKKQQYIAGPSDRKDYLEIFSEAEEHLEQCAPARAAERDIQLASKLDVDIIRSRRRANAAVLLDAFSDIAIFPVMGEQDCPMFVPILVPEGKRDTLRQYLITNEIYCPVHWPISQYHQLDEKTGRLYENELSLVCDQRYTEADMKRLVETLKKFWKE